MVLDGVVERLWIAASVSARPKNTPPGAAAGPAAVTTVGIGAPPPAHIILCTYSNTVIHIVIHSNTYSNTIVFDT